MKRLMGLVLLTIATATSATIVYPPVKYGQEVTIYFSLYDSNSPWQFYETKPDADDVYVRKDGGAAARATNAVGDLNHTMSLTLTATEMQAAIITVDVNDESSPALYGSETIIIPTFGHTSALQALDLDEPNVNADVVGWKGSTSGLANWVKWFSTNWATVFDDTNDVPNARVVNVSLGADVGDTSDIDATITANASVVSILEDTGTTLPATLGTPVALDGGTATLAGMLTKLADDNGGADYNAGTDSLKVLSDNQATAQADLDLYDTDAEHATAVWEALTAGYGGAGSYGAFVESVPTSTVNWSDVITDGEQAVVGTLPWFLNLIVNNFD